MTERVDGISNVFIYVMDSLRWDYTPESLTDRGVRFKTIAQGLFTPPSFSSLATGRYPQEHGVHGFRNRIPDSVPTIFDLPDVSTGFYAPADVGESGIYSVLNTGKTRLEQYDSGFLHMERDPSPHLPFADAESVEEYYRTRGADWERVRSEYESSIDHGLEKLDDRIKHLRSEDMLDETLIIVTSDHGELLGEHGCVGHSSPAVPELVYVPTVFIHPDIDSNSFAVNARSELIEHVDITETAMSALSDVGKRFPTAGTNVLADARPRSWGHNYVQRRRRGWDLYTAETIWWPDSGYTFGHGSSIGRFLFGLYQITQGSPRHAARKRPFKLIESYISSDDTFGTPPTDRGTARKVLDELVDNLESTESISSALNADTRERLKQLGYMT